MSKTTETNVTPAKAKPRVYDSLPELVRSEAARLNDDNFRAYRVAVEVGSRWQWKFVATNSPASAALAVVEPTRVPHRDLLAAALSIVNDTKNKVGNPADA